MGSKIFFVMVLVLAISPVFADDYVLFQRCAEINIQKGKKVTASPCNWSPDLKQSALEYSLHVAPDVTDVAGVCTFTPGHTGQNTVPTYISSVAANGTFLSCINSNKGCPVNIPFPFLTVWYNQWDSFEKTWDLETYIYKVDFEIKNYNHNSSNGAIIFWLANRYSIPFVNKNIFDVNDQMVCEFTGE